MSIGAAPELMTVEEFEALPDDGTDRELIRGELKERPSIPRGQLEGLASGEMAYALRTWLATRPEPRGRVVGDSPPRFFSSDQDLTAEDVLPGLCMRVGDLFA